MNNYENAENDEIDGIDKILKEEFELIFQDRDKMNLIVKDPSGKESFWCRLRASTILTLQQLDSHPNLSSKGIATLRLLSERSVQLNNGDYIVLLSVEEVIFIILMFPRLVENYDEVISNVLKIFAEKYIFNRIGTEI